MTDYDDYENNLAFKPIGDWADTEPKVNTDRTQSSLELVDKIKRLTEENTQLKCLLWECRQLFVHELTNLAEQISEVIDEKEQTDD